MTLKAALVEHKVQNGPVHITEWCVEQIDKSILMESFNDLFSLFILVTGTKSLWVTVSGLYCYLFKAVFVGLFFFFNSSIGISDLV